MNDYVSLAKQALKKPDDFGWFGFDEMFVTWGFSGISVSNASDILEASNYHSIIAHLKNAFVEEYDDNFREVGFSHWVVGHVDQVCLKILKTEVDHDLIVLDDITDFFIEAVDIVISLLEFDPIFNENDYDNRQWAAANSWIEEMANSNWMPFGHKCIVSDGFGSDIQEWIINNLDSYSEYSDDGTPIYDEDSMLEAIYQLGFDDRDNVVSDAYWVKWEKDNLSSVAQRINRRNEESGQLVMEF